MRQLAIAIVVSTALVCDLVANVTRSQSSGWDMTATVVALWGYFEWRKS